MRNATSGYEYGEREVTQGKEEGRRAPLSLHEEHGRSLDSRGRYEVNVTSREARPGIPITFEFASATRTAVDGFSCTFDR